MCYRRRAPGAEQVQEISGFRSQISAECPKGSDNKCVVLTIDQVGQVLWLIYKMSNYMSKGSLYTKICSQESEVTGMQEQQIKAVCTGTVSTVWEEIKQCEIITILGNRVRAGKVPMLAIDVAW